MKSMRGIRPLSQKDADERQHTQQNDRERDRAGSREWEMRVVLTE
jgi:hypothetical protein